MRKYGAFLLSMMGWSLASGCIVTTPGYGGGTVVTGGGGVVVAGGGGGALLYGGSVANFGVASLTAGFLPDPHTVSVISGGNIAVSSLGLGPGCLGYATRQPDYIVHWNGVTNNLRFFVTSGSDTTLIVNDAQGGWRCNDDSYGGLNPTVDIPGAGPGQYDVWVGSYRAGEQAHAVLHVTELDLHP